MLQAAKSSSAQLARLWLRSSTLGATSAHCPLALAPWGGQRGAVEGLSTAAPLAAHSQPPGQQGSQQQEEQIHGIDWGALFMYCPPALAGLLCYWQTQRKDWKEQVIATREAGVTREPDDVFSYAVAPEPYVKVRATGIYDVDKSMFVGPRAHGYYGRPQFGYHLVMPMYSPAAKKWVMINRGWVPDSWVSSSHGKLREVTPAGQTSEVCIVQPNEEANMSLPPNDPEQGDFYWAQAESLAQGAGLPPGTPLLQVVTTEQDLKPVKVIGSPKLQPPVHSGVGDAREPPLPRHEASLLHFAVMPHDHQMYAATWAIMSVVTAIMARMVLRKNGRRVFNFGRS